MIRKLLYSLLFALVTAVSLYGPQGASAQVTLAWTPYQTGPYQAYPGGYTASNVFVLTATGPDSWSGMNITITGPNASYFQQDTNVTPACFSFSHQCAWGIYFQAPTTPGQYTATLTATYTDNVTNVNGSATYALVANVVAPPTPSGSPNLSFVPPTTLYAGTPGVAGYSGVGVPASQAKLSYPGDIVFDSTGNAYIADTKNFVVRKVDTSGNITVYAGTPQQGGVGQYSGEGGAATSAKLQGPVSLAIDKANNLYIGDGFTTVLIVDAATQKITTYAGSTTYNFGYAGDGGPATSALFDGVNSLAIDSKGNLYILETTSGDVRKVDTSGIITTYAGKNQYYNNTSGYTPNFEGYSGDGGPAASATFYRPQAIAIDASDNLYVADDADRIRKIDATTTIITTVAGFGAASSYQTAAQTGTEGTPALQAEFYAGGVTVDPSGNIYIADSLPVANVPGPILKVDTTGAITQFPSTSSAGYGGFLKFDSTGAMYIMDQVSSAIYKVAAQGVLAFGDEDIGSTSAAQMLTLQNNGSSAIDFNTTPYTIAGNFAIGNSGTCSFSAPLAVGDTCTVAVTFTPQSSGQQTGTITFASNSATNPLIAHLSGNGTGSTSPQAVLNPTSVAFGDQTEATTSNSTVIQLSNPGTGSLTISNISLGGTNPTDFGLNTSACGTSLDAGDSCNISVDFTPASTGSYTALVTVTDNATAGTTQTVALTGNGTTAAAPQATLTPATYAFASQTIATTSGAQTFVLSNPGTSALTISSISITGTNLAEFSANSSACPSSLAAGASCNILVTFTPDTATSFTAFLEVDDNAPDNVRQRTTLTGTGSAAAAPIASVTPSTLAFGNQSIGVASTPMTVNFSNTGTATLLLSSVSIGGTNPTAFQQANGGTCDSAVAPGTSCTVAFSFTPPAVGSYTATASLANNSAGSPLVVTLTGGGTTAPAPVATLTPNPVALSNTNVGSTSAAVPVTLSNTGNAALSISSVTITGTDSSEFADTSACGTSLAAGSSCVISVTFTPSSAAAFTATLSVADNAAGSPHTTSLTGTGTIGAADYSVAASNPTLNIAPGGVAQFSFNVTALGGDYSQPVTLSVTGLPAGASASFNPATVTPGSTGATSVLSVQTASLTGALVSPHDSGSHFPLFATLLLLPLLRIRKLRRKLSQLPMSARALLLGALALGSIASLTGCGGGGYFGQQPQTVTLTITGTSGSLTHSTTVNLTIQ